MLIIMDNECGRVQQDVVERSKKNARYKLFVDYKTYSLTLTKTITENAPKCLVGYKERVLINHFVIVRPKSWDTMNQRRQNFVIRF